MGHFIDFTSMNAVWFQSQHAGNTVESDAPPATLYRGSPARTEMGAGISLAVLLFVVLILGVTALTWQLLRP